jgi:hypothetical protein
MVEVFEHPSTRETYKLTFFCILFRNSGHTSQETHYVSVTEPNRLMLFGETVAFYCENHMEHTDTVRTTQETHYVSATEPNRIMLFGEIVAVYCENHMEHTDTVRTTQETHDISAIEPNRLMLFGETVAVYYRYSPYHTGNTLRLRYRAQPVNAVWGNSSCLL